MARRRSANLNEPSQVPALPNSNHSRRREKDGKPGPRPSLTCLDLFCGCGGFSLGMERAGFRTLAAVDVDPVAVAVYRCNFPHVPHVLQEDLTTFHPAELAEILAGAAMDVIVGGPPCQGFSNVRRPSKVCCTTLPQELGSRVEPLRRTSLVFDTAFGHPDDEPLPRSC